MAQAPLAQAPSPLSLAPHAPPLAPARCSFGPFSRWPRSARSRMLRTLRPPLRSLACFGFALFRSAHFFVLWCRRSLVSATSGLVVYVGYRGIEPGSSCMLGKALNR
ncbi:hypothetical protein ACTXT7_017648 [Hymenolepis weldensis]